MAGGGVGTHPPPPRLPALSRTHYRPSSRRPAAPPPLPPPIYPPTQLFPLQNVDGRALFEAGELCRRKTAAGVDLNRNWPYAWQGGASAEDEMYGGARPLSEPITRAMHDWALQWRPRGYINVHSGEWSVYSVWDSKRAYAPGLPVRVG